jgi:hypothetical protein
MPSSAACKRMLNATMELGARNDRLCGHDRLLRAAGVTVRPFWCTGATLLAEGAFHGASPGATGVEPVGAAMWIVVWLRDSLVSDVRDAGQCSDSVRCTPFACGGFYTASSAGNGRREKAFPELPLREIKSTPEARSFVREGAE